MPMAETVINDYNKLTTVEQNEVKSQLLNLSFTF